MSPSGSRGLNRPFDGGLLVWLQGGTSPAGRGRNRVVRGVALTIALGWLPLLVLAGVASATGQSGVLSGLLHDCAVHARSLIAAPLFVLADAVCTPRLAAIARHFREADLVPEGQLARYDAIVADTAKLARSPTASLCIIAAAYLIVFIVTSTTPQLVPTWHHSGALGLSLAGWWHVLVSQPLLTALFGAWVWRVILWARFLSRVARFDLKLVPVHPDRAAGLLFVGYSVRAFAVVALPMGCVVAGAICSDVLEHGSLRFADWLVASMALIAALAMFAAPPFIFGGKLLRAWRRGTFEYGALAGRLGMRLEQKWFSGGAEVDETALEAPAFSATTDLYQLVSNAYQMRFAPVDVASLLLLSGAVLVPLVPVILLTVPFGNVAAALKNLLL